MGRKRRATGFRVSTLPWLKPGLITHHVGEASVFTEAEDIVKQTGTLSHCSCTAGKPASVTLRGTYAQSTSFRR